MMFVPNQLVLETSQPSSGPQRREMSQTWPGDLTTFQRQIDQKLVPEANRHSQFSQYRSSRDRSSNNEDHEVSQRGSLRFNSGYSGSSNLPKLKLNNFDGIPLGWPQRSSTFIDTVDQRPRLREDEPPEDSNDKQGKVSNLWIELFWRVLWCCLEHSGEEVWKASCDH